MNARGESRRREGEEGGRGRSGCELIGEPLCKHTQEINKQRTRSEEGTELDGAIVGASVDAWPWSWHPGTRAHTHHFAIISRLRDKYTAAFRPLHALTSRRIIRHKYTSSTPSVMHIYNVSEACASPNSSISIPTHAALATSCLYIIRSRQVVQRANAVRIHDLRM